MAEKRDIYTVKLRKSVAALVAFTLIATDVGFISAKNALAETPDSDRNTGLNGMVFSQSPDKLEGKDSGVLVRAETNRKNIKLNIMPLDLPEQDIVRIDSFAELWDGEVVLLSSGTSIGRSWTDAPPPVSLYERLDHFQKTPIRQNPPGTTMGSVTEIGWSVHDFGYGYFNEEVKFIALGDHKLTFHAEMDNIDFHNVGFYNWCSDPAASYFTDNYHGQIREWVLIVRLERDVRLVGDTQCEEELYRPPHDHVRIIDPLLLAVPAGPQSIFLAGGSYAPMPFVIKYDADTGIVGDGVSVFVIDKSEIDRIRQAASDEYESIMASDPEHLNEYGSAGLAALIERRISEYVSKNGSK